MSESSRSTPDRPQSLESRAALEAFVSQHPTALVEFHTEGCSKCAAMEPVLGGVARASDVAIGTINPRDDPPLIEEYDVRSVPLLVAFVDGDPVARKAEGFVPMESVCSWLETVLE